MSKVIAITLTIVFAIGMVGMISGCIEHSVFGQDYFTGFTQ